MAAFGAPLALVLGLALAGGGFDITTRHVAGIAVWLVCIVALLAGLGFRARFGRPFLLIFGAILALALFTGLSAAWSGSAERSVDEAARVLTYLGFFLLAYLLTQTSLERQRFMEGLAVGVATIAVLGVVSRLLPDLIAASESQRLIPVVQARLGYPLGYWNADGAMFGLAAVALLWLAHRGSNAVLRASAAAALPAALLALYFTYSRGGVLTLAVGCVFLIVLSRDRLWYLLSAAVAAAVTVPLLLAVQDRRELADGIVGQAATDQGQTVLFFLIVAMAVSVGAHLLLRLIESRQGRGTSAILDLSRNPVLLRVIAATAVIAVLGLAVTVGDRAWERFSESRLEFPTKSEQHFTELRGQGRKAYWTVAVNAFEDRPIAGQGAGTYEFDWEREREIVQPVRDAHSLYLEALGELGLVGAILTVAVVGGVLGLGIAAWRRSDGAERDAASALLAMSIAFAVAAGIDWHWEMAALGAVFFLAAGWLTSLAGAGAGAERKPLSPPRFALTLGIVLVGWVSTALLVSPLISAEEIEASQEAVARGDLKAAIDHADSARDIQPWAASPYLQLALIAELIGDDRVALEQIDKAIDREPANWQLWVVRGRVQVEAGRVASARRSARRARRLNPLAATEIQATVGIG
ncbi:MAG: O-antigen ligase family protein [Actinomycetota bacterium]